MNAELIKGPQRATFKWDSKGVVKGYVLIGTFDFSKVASNTSFKTHSITFARQYWDTLIQQGFKRASPHKLSIRKATTELLNEFEAAQEALQYKKAWDGAAGS